MNWPTYVSKQVDISFCIDSWKFIKLVVTTLKFIENLFMIPISVVEVIYFGWIFTLVILWILLIFGPSSLV